MKRYTITGRLVEWEPDWHVEAQAALDMFHSARHEVVIRRSPDERYIYAEIRVLR